MKRRDIMQVLAGAAATAFVSKRELAAQEQVARATRGMPSPKIKDVIVIATAPGSNYPIVKILTDQDGLYGYGCACFTQRAELVVPAVEKYRSEEHTSELQSRQ